MPRPHSGDIRRLRGARQGLALVAGRAEAALGRQQEAPRGTPGRSGLGVPIETVARTQTASSGRNLGSFLQVEQGCLYSLVDFVAFVDMKIGVDGLQQGPDQITVDD